MEWKKNEHLQRVINLFREENMNLKKENEWLKNEILESTVLLCVCVCVCVCVSLHFYCIYQNLFTFNFTFT